MNSSNIIISIVGAELSQFIRRRLVQLCSGLGLLILGVAFTNPAVASAFSGYGAGTSGNPYRIGTCTQLQEIGNNLSAYYTLVRDIDCTGVSFSTMGFFAGTLDGQNHTVTGLSINGSGIFSDTNTGAVIKNLWLTNGSVTGSAYTGSIVGITDGTTLLDNVHSSLGINGGVYTGGLVGMSDGGTLTVNQSSYTGTLTTSGSYSGGLVGEYSTGTLTITNSYVRGSISGQTYTGVLVGDTSDLSLTISKSYGAANYNVAGKLAQGGLVGGFFDGTVSNSFGANTFTGTPGGSTVGSLFGYGFGASTNNYADTYLANSLVCSGLGSASCTSVNSGNATPGYFKNSTTNAPLDTWDFTNVWAKNTTDYPSLHAEANFIRPTPPNSGDANGDSTLDKYQATVVSIKNSSNVWSTVTIPTSSSCSLDNPQSLDSTQLATDAGYTHMTGSMSGFTVYCPTAGATVPVTIIYDQQYDTSNWVLRYYNTNTQQYSSVSGATFGTTTVGGVVKTTVTYSVTDGGAYDGDGAANGVIVDPVGPASVPGTSAPISASSGTTTPAAPDTGFGVVSQGKKALTYLIAAIGCILLGMLLRRYSHQA